MYSSLKNVQVIISLLKQNNIKHLVLSPGTRDFPLVHSVEQDNYFKCYSCVDERSAAYFAYGLSKKINEPVCLSCTSSTATCNYLPAVVQSSKENVPLILLTADRNNYLLKQGEDQLIVQEKMYGEYVRCAVNLPIVSNNSDLNYCIRKTNEALLFVKGNNIGPVHINFQVQGKDLCKEKLLPEYRKVTKILEEEEQLWINKAKELTKYNKILIIFGQSYYDYESRKKIENYLDIFCKKNNCIVSVEETSNIKCINSLKTCRVMEAMTDKEFLKYKPDLVITFGNHFFSFLKYKLRNIGNSFVHWRVSENDTFIDNFNALTTIFICEPATFLNKMNQNKTIKNNSYYDLMLKRMNRIKFPKIPYSNWMAVSKFCEKVPEESIVHLTILNALRLFNFLNNKSVNAFCNLGADGIDGGISTFYGQADAKKMSFIICGDLSFLYDLNSSILNHSKNIRILLINNFAGSEFHNNFGLEKIPTLNDYIAAGHNTKIEQIISSTNFKYISAHNEKELDIGFIDFFKSSEEPIIFEVFTDANIDSKVLKEFYSINKNLTLKDKMLKNGKNILKKILKGMKFR